MEAVTIFDPLNGKIAPVIKASGFMGSIIVMESTEQNRVKNIVVNWKMMSSTDKISRPMQMIKFFSKIL